MSPPASIVTGLIACAAVAAGVSVFLLLKSLKDFSRTGPRMREEVQGHYFWYSARALTRLSLWSFGISFVMAGAGALIWGALCVSLERTPSISGQGFAALAGLAIAIVRQFLHTLHNSPATIVASSNYELRRFKWLWQRLTPGRLIVLDLAIMATCAVIFLSAARELVRQNRWTETTLLGAIIGAALLVWWYGLREEEPRPRRAKERPEVRPNILMLGSDTLRADRLGVAGYYRSLTPRLDALARQGTLFTHCFVPCARTAPSLTSLLSGCWPHRYGVRDNYVADADTRLSVPRLPALLQKAGYRTAAVGDWSASDLAKFDFGFDEISTPPDQWNIKYLLRQGPKDLRLFLSLFLSNPIGRRVLPEIFYLAGVPRTRQVGLQARQALSELAGSGQPFLLTMFTATTHPPFGSEHPYYRMFSDPGYRGDSTFAMARLTDPFDIIRRQGEARSEFDLDQIEDLYDGCVRAFDDEVRRVLAHLDYCGLAANTIVVVFSDHGMEFFEHGTWGQGNSIFGDYSARTPLIIADPRSAPGSSFNQVIRNIDIAPTLLELALGTSSLSMDGISLANSIRENHEPPPLLARTETGIWLTDLPGTPATHLRYPDLMDLLHVPDKSSGTLVVKPMYANIVVAAKDRMIRSDRWRLTYQPMVDGCIVSLFDVKQDPACIQDVIDRFPKEAEQLIAELDQWLSADPPVRRLNTTYQAWQSWRTNRQRLSIEVPKARTPSPTPPFAN